MPNLVEGARLVRILSNLLDRIEVLELAQRNMAERLNEIEDSPDSQDIWGEWDGKQE